MAINSITSRIAGARPLVRVDLQSLAPNPYQPRREFSQRSLDELAQSIRQYGLLSPLLVRRVGAGRYELIAGERRVRALMMLGQRAADAIVIGAFDCDSALLALIENLQRENLHYLEEAEAYRVILIEHGITQEALAHRLGKSPSAVANRLRLLKLPSSVRESLRRFSLSERHARALLKLDDEQLQLRAAETAGEKKLSVKQLELLVENLLMQAAEQKRKPPVARLYRDQRLSVNAVLDTVKALNEAGVPATSRVEQREDCIEITIVLPVEERQRGPAPLETPLKGQVP